MDAFRLEFYSAACRTAEPARHWSDILQMLAGTGREMWKCRYKRTFCIRLHAGFRILTILTERTWLTNHSGTRMVFGHSQCIPVNLAEKPEKKQIVRHEGGLITE